MSPLDDTLARARSGDPVGAWALLDPILEQALAPDAPRDLAERLAHFLGERDLDREGRLARANRLLARWRADLGVITALGWRAESLADLRYLNAAPPDDPFFEDLANALADAGDAATTAAVEGRVAAALSPVARICGRRWDAACEQAHRRVLALRGSWQDWYDYGLFLKNRGRFAEGLEANRRARDGGGTSDEAVLWNLAICATGAGEGAAALKVWEGMGHQVTLDAHGLPTGRWQSVEVRLAERPVAERTAADDDPGREETVWIERLSACHGRVQSPTYADLGVDYGDLVLFDGAAIASRERGGRQVLVFPHLATLRRGGWTLLRFVGRQTEPGAVERITLPGGAFLYNHTERVRTHCLACWEKGESTPHDHAEEPHTLVTGKLAVPPDGDLRAVAARLAVPSGVTLHVPELWRRLGMEARAEQEAARALQLEPEA